MQSERCEGINCLSISLQQRENAADVVTRHASLHTFNMSHLQSDGKRILSPCSPNEHEPNTQRARFDGPYAPSYYPGLDVNQMVQGVMSKNESLLAPGVIGTIIKDVLTVLQPFIASTIETCVRKAVEEMNNQVWEETNYMKDEMLDLSWKVDDNEQYSRKDNIRVVGWNDGQAREDNTNQLVIDTCAKMGVDITENDISTSHWLPGKKPTLIAQYTRRDTKKRP